jgi:FixJ family two-component response regulator
LAGGRLPKFASDFLNFELPDVPTCLVLAVRMPGTSGLELQEHLVRLNMGLPILLMTAFGDVSMSVEGMKAGAIDFLTKPVRDQDLLDAVAAAIRVGQDAARGPRGLLSCRSPEGAHLIMTHCPGAQAG